ncbi:hypothetical protein BLA29_004054 [Euroglyphus maynei]|uniref:Uncharacterized protein n=1 Tax=Euroglyphus maynei TaxID=6958 RepID=A0A1Y3BIE0_EURMA|nr:hypothetical protein BLA29_004054 [Euroglyphus maynei]
MKMWIFMLILPIFMVNNSIAIGHSKSDEIVARIDLIKVPNFNLFLPRLSLINCNAWWLDYKLFDSSNIEIIIPIALQRFTEESKTVSGTDGSLCIDENGSFVSSKP